MNSKVTIVMYHYVRDLKNSRYSEIKGLDVSLFKEQINYFKKYYNVITMEALIEAIKKNTSLPPKSLLLTFDDGYIDHYTCVFPILVDNGIQGSFYPPVKAITDQKVLDVNKIHFILAASKNCNLLLNSIYKLLDNYRSQYNLNSNSYYYNKLAKSNRFDTSETVFIKRLLQVELPEKLRSIITDSLFEEYITITENSFARELYMTIDQIKTMKHFGMHFGSHGFNHYWLNSLTKAEQQQEIIKSKNFLQSIGIDEDCLTIAYPYGGYNEETLALLSENNFKLALTTNVNVADFLTEHKYSLSRLDVNDLPTNQIHDSNNWYFAG